jgi:hypothetical protein
MGAGQRALYNETGISKINGQIKQQDRVIFIF